MLDYLRNDWSDICQGRARLRQDAMGNLEICMVRGSEAPTVALVAHADTICAQITCPAGANKFRFRSIGCSPHMLLGQPLTIITESGEKFPGAVGFDPTSQFGQPKGLVFEDLWIDVFDAPSNSINTGDLAVLTPRCEFYGDLVSGTSLDDRAGLSVITEVLESYINSDILVNLVCLATVQEEVGLRGAAGFEFTIKPDAVIVVDVDYATDVPASHPDQTGILRLHEGPGVHRKADNTPALRQKIKQLATEHQIPLQTTVGRFTYGGTDSTQLQIARSVKGCAVCNLTIPCRYMHSPVETVSLRDMESAAKLLYALLRSYGE